MNLLRVAIVGAVALLGATSAASSCSDESSISGSADNDYLEHNAESGSAHGGEVDKKDRVAIFAHEWPMAPASFINYVSGHGVCPDTLEGRNAEDTDYELDAEAVDDGQRNPTSLNHDTCAADTANDTLEGTQAGDDDADVGGAPINDNEMNAPTSGDDSTSLDILKITWARTWMTKADAADVTLACSADAASGDIILAGTVESVLVLQRQWQRDPRMRVVLSRGSISEPPSVRMTELITTLGSRTVPTKIVQLTAGTQVQAASVNAFAISTSKDSWVFSTRDRAQRNVWITALVDAIKQTGHTATSDGADVVSDEISAVETGNPSDVLDLKTPYMGMKPRKVTLAGSALTVCKLTKDGRETKSCEEIILDSYADAVSVAIKQGRRGRGRAFFTVTTDSSASTKSWTFDAGSLDEQARWIALIKGAVREANGNDGTGEEHEAKESSEQGSIESRFRGWKLGPKDPPLEPGMFLSNLNENQPTALEVTKIGDVLLSAGLLPDRTQDPLWAFRSTGASGVNALGCSLESFWQRLWSRDETQVTLSVKNGRWRVGRGRMCTLGRSPAPEGSLRRFLPWDERGQDIINAELQLVQDGTAIIRSDSTVLWDSYWD